MQRIPEIPPKIAPLPHDIKRPLWSVMIPTYNCASFIAHAIESVLQQNISAELMQIEVVDDCSTDEDIAALVKRIGKGRVQFFRQEQNVGSLRNFETCINRAKGKYVHILHGDDAVELKFYATIGNLFEKFPQAGAAFTNFCYINPQNSFENNRNKSLMDNPGILQDFLVKIAKRQLIQPPAIVVKREVYEDLGSFYAAHYGEDWEMWSRIASKYPIAYSPQTLACYRVAQNSGISYSSFLTGQNIEDIKKIVDIISSYVPQEKRKDIKNYALSNFTIYCFKIASGLLDKNKRAAFLQVEKAFQMHRDALTWCWYFRFYLMYFTRYKQLRGFIGKVWGKFDLKKNIPASIKVR